MRNQMKSLVLASTMMLAAACGASQKAATPPVTASASATPQPTAAEDAAEKERQALNASSSLSADLSGDKAPLFEPLYFSFDSTDLKPESEKTLREIADYMIKNKADLTVSGHCDERGSPEYNLALGDRRASSARAYLKRLGVPAERVHVVSYGSERPALVGEGEAVWSKNRRDEFQVASGEDKTPSATR